MSEFKQAILLIGSPKLKESTSESLGTYLLKQLEKQGFITSMLHVYKCLKNEDGVLTLLQETDEADLIIFASPLYADSLPAHIIKALEIMFNHRKETLYIKRQDFIAIINCGFPEAEQNDAAIKLCRMFARRVGLNWRGSFAIGMGGIINGNSLDKRRILNRNIRRAFRKASPFLANGETVPKEIRALASKQMLPTSMYVMGGNLNWKRQANKLGTRKELDRKPYVKKK